MGRFDRRHRIRPATTPRMATANALDGQPAAGYGPMLTNRVQRILRATRRIAATATRAELKLKYVEMAKLSHPDAQIGSAVEVRSNDEDEAPDFGEVAAAWRILGDSKSRKRYDRELQYKEWAAFASKYANEKMEEAVPAVARIMDDLALPFLRRTAATTVAVSQVVSNIAKTVDSSSSRRDAPQNENKNLITNTFMNAVRAGQKAGRAIDTLELNEKSAQLSQRYVYEIRTPFWVRLSRVMFVAAVLMYYLALFFVFVFLHIYTTGLKTRKSVPWNFKRSCSRLPNSASSRHSNRTRQPCRARRQDKSWNTFLQEKK